jgi:hypothetical protein
MKKIIVIIIALVCSYTLIGQTTTTAVLGTDTIYLPQIAQDGCYNVCDTGCENIVNDANHSQGILLGDLVSAGHLIELAQPYSTHNAISIKGIAFCAQLSSDFSYFSTNYAFHDSYVQILDSATNTILASVNYDTLPVATDMFGPIPHTYKVYFDSSITVSGDFLAAITISKQIFDYCDFGGIFSNTGTCENGNTYPSPLIKWANSTSWEEWRTSTNSFMLQGHFNTMNILLIYPILGEKHNNSSISQVDIKDAVTLYPNPASNKLYLASSFGINKIEVFNIMGQKLKEDEVNCSNYNLDISNFAKGNYIVKIITPRGTTEKKFIKE